MNGSVPYMDPGVNQVDVAMRPRNYRQRMPGGCSRAAWLDLVHFRRGGSCRDHTWPCVHISSPARGHLVALWVSRGGDNWSCKCLGLMSRTVLNSLLRVFPLKPLMASTHCCPVRSQIESVGYCHRAG